MRYQLYPHIVAGSAVHGGKPVIEGTQVLVRTLIEQVAAGKSLEEVARENGVGVEDVRAALRYGAQHVGEPVVVNGTEPDSTDRVPSVPQATIAVDDEARRVGLDPDALSPLGRRLLELRARGIAAREPRISSWEELEAEIAARRGGNYPDAGE